MEKKGRKIPDVLLVFFHQQCFWPFLPRPPFLLAGRPTVIWAKCNSELFFPDAVVSCHIARCYWGTVPKNKISAGKCRVTRKYCAKNMKARRPRARLFNWKQILLHSLVSFWTISSWSSHIFWEEKSSAFCSWLSIPQIRDRPWMSALFWSYYSSIC